MSSSIENSLNRNQTIDYPLLVFYALIGMHMCILQPNAQASGNDVCSPHHSLDSMTKPHDFYENIMRSLVSHNHCVVYMAHIRKRASLSVSFLWALMLY